MSPQLPFWHRPLSWKGVVLALSAFVALNVGLYAVQEYLARDEVKACETLETQLKTELREIDQLKTWLTSQQRRLDGQRAVLELEPVADVDHGYDGRVSLFNEEVEQYNLAIERLPHMIAAYNSRIDRYNSLAKSAYSRFIIWPGLRTKSRSRLK